MNTNSIVKLKSSFDAIVQQIPDSDVEFWFAREIMSKLGYDRWENFCKVIHKASIACKTVGTDEANHFRGVTKMVKIGSGAERPIEDIMLTRYACYLIAQNGDSRKEAVAFSQTYFAVQTRKQEIIEERMRLHERLQARQRDRGANL